jgi:hypothetical protein
MYRSLFKACAAAIASSALLVACGGGGGGSTVASSGGVNTTGSGSTVAPSTNNDVPIALPTTVISGIFDGKTDTGQPLTALLQDDGSYFIVYSNAAVPQNFLGAVTGSGNLANGSFSSANGVDASLVGTGTQAVNPATLSASYMQKQSFNGTISYTASNQTKSFTSAYNSSYETLPSLSSLAGVYSGSIATKDLREDNINLTISSDGTLTGALTCGCSIGAKLVPRKDGMAYDATLSFTAGDHPLTGKSFAGNVYLDAQSKRLYIVGKLSNSTDSVIFVGNKS